MWAFYKKYEISTSQIDIELQLWLQAKQWILAVLPLDLLEMGRE